MKDELENIENYSFEGGKQLPYVIPINFWEEQENSILSKKASVEIIGENLPLELPFTIPDGFFANLELNILAKTNKVEMPLISLPACLPFTTNNYPSELEQKILAKTVSKTIPSKEAKVISFNWKAYAVAATIAVCFLLGWLISFKNSSTNNLQASAPDLQEVSHETIVNYLATESISISDIHETTNAQAIETAIEEINYENLDVTDLDNLSDNEINEFADEISL